MNNTYKEMIDNLDNLIEGLEDAKVFSQKVQDIIKQNPTLRKEMTTEQKIEVMGKLDTVDEIIKNLYR